jgi:hypothetical protein
MRLIDLTGKVFGRLTVIELSDMKGPNSEPIWRCLCSCGKVATVRGISLKTGNTRSCGCLRRDVLTSLNKSAATHGRTRTPEFNIWCGIKKRCLNPKDKDYPNYGGRGVTICERWLRFENFLKDMGERPRPSLSIERRNNGGDYEPSNCYWATRSQQAINRRPRSRNKKGQYE